MARHTTKEEYEALMALSMENTEKNNEHEGNVKILIPLYLDKEVAEWLEQLTE